MRTSIALQGSNARGSRFAEGPLRLVIQREQVCDEQFRVVYRQLVKWPDSGAFTITSCLATNHPERRQ